MTHTVMDILKWACNTVHQWIQMKYCTKIMKTLDPS